MNRQIFVASNLSELVNILSTQSKKFFRYPVRLSIVKNSGKVKIENCISYNSLSYPRETEIELIEKDIYKKNE